MSRFTIEGKVAFSHVQTHDEYKGRSTGRFTLTLLIEDEAAADELEQNGVKLKDYEGNKQRKFASKFPVIVVDKDDNVVTEEIPRGSKVRVLYSYGADNPEHGVATFLERVRVLEFTEATSEVPDEF